MENRAERKALSLYVHIPFCVRKCAYCDFLSAPASEKEKEHYVNILCGEIEREAVRYPGYRVETVFFGGGTPTVLKPDQLDKILCKLKSCFMMETAEGADGEPEITLECNPGTAAGEDLRKLRGMGFNRLSLGLQSARNEELRKLGRIHTWEEFLETWYSAREAGFRNINVDLMAALPGQKIESYVNSLERVMELSPEHISAYSLIIEEGTPFYERYGEADEQRKRYGEDREHLLPSEEEERAMYERTREILARGGYHRYEISNYARPGYECRHNITYWKRGDYLGFGLGAASLMKDCRFANAGGLAEYEGGLRREKRQLSVQEQMEEFMFLGLRLTEGVTSGAFWDAFHVSIENIYGSVLKKLECQGLLAREGERIFLTGPGIDVSNMALAEFLL
ncbi:radical SAM family heme chaperone HemW [Lachnospiraceae bacterium 38-10]